MNHLKVLIVEDDQSSANCFKSLLAEEGCTVYAHRCEDDIVGAVKKHSPHVLVVSLDGSTHCGMVIARDIRALDDDVALILVSSSPKLEIATEALALSASDYLKKPCQKDEIVTALRRIAKKKRILQSSEEALHASIGHNIRQARKSRGLTLKQLSRRTALSVSLLSQIERAESSASVTSLFKVSNALDVPLTSIFAEF